MTGIDVAVETAMIADDAALTAFASQPVSRQAGAVVDFVGVVRDHDHGRSVRELEYVAHPSAAAVLQSVAADLAARHSEVLSIRVAHRHGVLGIGDRALVAEVTAAHRGPAFLACAELVEEVKRLLPVWKRQVFTDGTDEWVNCP